MDEEYSIGKLVYSRNDGMAIIIKKLEKDYYLIHWADGASEKIHKTSIKFSDYLLSEDAGA